MSCHFYCFFKEKAYFILVYWCLVVCSLSPNCTCFHPELEKRHVVISIKSNLTNHSAPCGQSTQLRNNDAILCAKAISSDAIQLRLGRCCPQAILLLSQSWAWFMRLNRCLSLPQQQSPFARVARLSFENYNASHAAKDVFVSIND